MTSRPLKFAVFGTAPRFRSRLGALYCEPSIVVCEFWRCRSCRKQPWRADQVVAGHCQGELEAELFDTSQHGPGKAANRLAPAEWLLDALPLPLAHCVAGMPRGAAVDRGTSPADILRNMRRHVERAHVGHE